MFVQMRQARVEDAPALLKIYRYYVEETAVSFEIETPSTEAFAGRVEKTLRSGFPYIVLEEDGVILGYAYAGRFIPRAAYDHCCELTIYLDRAVVHRGLGSMLYGTLIAVLQQRGMTHFYACIGVPREEDDPYLTHASEQFHHKMGFVTCGRFAGSGKKFGRMYDMIWCGIEPDEF